MFNCIVNILQPITLKIKKQKIILLMNLEAEYFREHFIEMEAEATGRKIIF